MKQKRKEKDKKKKEKKAKWESISNKWVDHIPHNIRSATIYELKRLIFSSVNKRTREK